MAESAPAPDLAQLVAAFAIMEKAGRARRLMSASVFFQGKKITQAERALLAKAFGETIDDMHVCHTVLIRAMHKLPFGVLQAACLEVPTGGVVEVNLA